MQGSEGFEGSHMAVRVAKGDENSQKVVDGCRKW